MPRPRAKQKHDERSSSGQEDQGPTKKPGRPPAKKKETKKKQSAASSASPPGSGRPSTTSSTNARKSVEVMREIFNNAQHVHQINPCLEQLNKMIKDYDERIVYEELKRNITFSLLSPEKSPHTKNIINFISRFLIRESKRLLEKENESEGEPEPLDESTMDELGLEAVGMDAFSPGAARTHKKKKKSAPKITIVDSILMDVLIPYLSNGSATVRLNGTNIVRKVFDELDDLESSVFRKLKRALLDRLSDKSATIRASAAKSLHRFQEVQIQGDIVTAAFNFHLKNDPDHDVRASILLAIEPSKETMEEIINRTRDVKDQVRKAAYHKIAERVQIRALSIAQRLQLIKEGLNEKSPAVKKVVEKELITSWFKSCNNDLVKFLIFLDIQSDPKTIDKLLNCLFMSFLNSKSDRKTKLHDYVESFCGALLDSRKLLLKQPLTVENCFIWRALAQFLRENESKIQPVIKVTESEPQNEEEAEIDEMLNNMQIPDPVQGVEGSQPEDSSADSSSQPSPSKGPTPPKKPKTKVTKDQELDLVDMVIPQLPHFCNYVKKFAITIDKKEYDEDQLMDYDFIYGELIKILLFLEVGDDAQRNILLNTVHDIMFLPKLSYKMTDVISPLMKVLAQNVFKNQSDLLQFTSDLTTEVHNQVLDSHEKDEEKNDVEMKPVVMTPAEIRELEMRFAKAVIDIEMMKDEYDDLIKLATPESLGKASKLKGEMNKLIEERENIDKRLNEKLGDFIIPSQSTQQSEAEGKLEQSISDFPEALLKCLQIFAGCLEFGDIKGIDTKIQSHIDNICFPGIVCTDDDRVRGTAIKALGLCCIVSCTLARRYFALFLQIVKHDNQHVSNIALQAMFDFLCEFGVQEMVRPGDQQHAESRTTNERTLEGTADIDIDIPEPELANIEDQDTDNPVVPHGDEMTYEQFSNQLILLIRENLFHDSEVIRFTTTQGTGKLMLLGKVYSPLLLTQLILLWYNPFSTTAIKHFLGVYFPLFAFQNTRFRSSAAGQSAFEEAFIDTIEMAHIMNKKECHDFKDYEFGITPSEIENMIVFMANLMTDEAHVRVLDSVCNKIIDLLPKKNQDDFVYKYLFKALSCLTIDSATNRQLKELKMLVDKIDKFVSSSSLAAKIPSISIRRLEKLSEKIESTLERMKEAGNNSSLSMDRTLTGADAAEGGGEEGDGDGASERNESRGGERGDENDDDEEDDDSTSVINYNLLNRTVISEAANDADSGEESDEEDE